MALNPEWSDDEVMDSIDEEDMSSSKEAFQKIALYFLEKMKQKGLADTLQMSKINTFKVDWPCAKPQPHIISHDLLFGFRINNPVDCKLVIQTCYYTILFYTILYYTILLQRTIE